MLKQRIVASIFVQNGIAVQSIGFKRYLPLGRAEIAAEAFNAWGADEILLIDISANYRKEHIDLDLVHKVADVCSIPLTVGGGLSRVDAIKDVIEAGADKVALNTAFMDTNRCIRDAYQKFGKQSIVAVANFIKVENEYLIYDYRKSKPTNKKLSIALIEYLEQGAGELLVNDVERDGSKLGFNLDLIKYTIERCNAPIIWSGGAGHPNHIYHALRINNLSGVAAGNMLNFTEHSINLIKAMVSKNITLRNDTQANYSNVPMTFDGRISKIDENKLTNLMHEKLHIESI